MESLGTKLLAALGVVLIAVAAYGAHALQVSHLRNDLTKMEQQRDQARASAQALKAANDDFSIRIGEQNKQIEAWKAAEALRKQARAAATAKAKVEGAKGQTRAQTTLKRPMSKPGDVCGSLDALLSETIRSRK